MPTPYDARIQQQRQRIQRHDGNDNRLRNKLQNLKNRRFNAQQAEQTPLPWSGEAESTIGTLNRNYDTDIAGLAAQEQTVRKGFGFDDNSDPFSRARQIKENYDHAQQGTGNNYAAQGQLYAGSLSNARDIDRQGFEQNWDAGQKDYASQLDELNQRRLDAQRTRDEGTVEATAQQLSDALSERTDPAEAPKRAKVNKPKNNKPQNKPNHNGGKKGRK